MVSTGLLYFGFFIFLFVIGGIAGDIMYHGVENVFVIGGLIVGIIGSLIGRFILSLMRI